MSKYNYDYNSATFIDNTSKGVSKDDVFKMLFIATQAGGKPACDFDMKHIDKQSSTDITDINVKEVIAKDGKKENYILFEVRSNKGTDITAPRGMPKDDVRVLHEQRIPYDRYQISILNG